MDEERDRRRALSQFHATDPCPSHVRVPEFRLRERCGDPQLANLCAKALERTTDRGWASLPGPDGRHARSLWK